MIYKKKYELADRRITERSDEQRYCDLYRRLARELQEATGAFTIGDTEVSADGQIRGLNLCMAPGGYTRAMLDRNPKMLVR